MYLAQGTRLLQTATAALACDMSPNEATQLANYAAGIVVSKFGTATCSAEELSQFYTTPIDSNRWSTFSDDSTSDIVSSRQS